VPSPCNFDQCLASYNNLKSLIDKQSSDEDYSYVCSVAHVLKDCMRTQSKVCRGDLNFHFLEKLVRDRASDINMKHNCKGKNDGSIINSQAEPRTRRPMLSRPIDKCSSKVRDQNGPTVGCAVFGLTNLKSFSESFNYSDINYCSLAGAWSVIDTPEFAVQITNKGGLSPLPKDITATTLVSTHKITAQSNYLIYPPASVLLYTTSCGCRRSVLSMK